MSKNKLAIKELNESKSKKDTTDISMETYCSICSKEIFPIRTCFGHGGGGGGDSGEPVSKNDGAAQSNNPVLMRDTTKKIDGWHNQTSPFDTNSLYMEQKNELEKYVNAILNELEKFKIDNGISADCKKIKRDDKNENPCFNPSPFKNKPTPRGWKA